MADRQYVLQLRAAKNLIEICQDPLHVQLYNQILAYFTPYCDCDIRAWLIEKIEANDEGVIAAIRILIQGDEPAPLPVVSAGIAQGFLISTSCVGQNLTGKFYSGTGMGTLDSVLVANHPQCAPPNEYWIKDPLMDAVGVLLFDHLPEIGGPYTFDQNMAEPQHRLTFKDVGVDNLNPAMQSSELGAWGGISGLLRQFTYINEAEIDSTQAEMGITLRTGIVGGKPDWPPVMKLTFSSRMETDLNFPTTNAEREQIHFLFTFNNGVVDDGGEKKAYIRYYHRDEEREYGLNTGYDTFYNQMSPGEKAQFDDIAGYPKIMTRRMPSGDGVGYEVKILLRLVKGVWELYLNGQYVMEAIYAQEGDPGIPWPSYQAGFGLATFSHNHYEEQPDPPIPYNWKTYLKDYFVRRLTEQTHAALTFAMVTQERFTAGNTGTGNFDNLGNNDFFVLGKAVEMRENNQTPVNNNLVYPTSRTAPIRVPFHIGGVPTLGGVPNYSGITFKKWKFNSGALEEGTLLADVNWRGNGPEPSRYDMESDQQAMMAIEFNSVTGRGFFVIPNPAAVGFGHALFSISYNGDEYLSVSIQYEGPLLPTQSSSGKQGELYVGFSSDLYYPYARFSLLY